MTGMKETRLNRFKEYRNSCLKDGSLNSSSLDLNRTTSFTLPLEDVIKVEQVAELKERIEKVNKLNKKLIIGLIISILCFIILGFVFFAYVAFWR